MADQRNALGVGQLDHRSCDCIAKLTWILGLFCSVEAPSAIVSAKAKLLVLVALIADLGEAR